SAELLAAALGADGTILSALAAFHHATVSLGDTRILAASVPDLGVRGFDLFVPVEAAGELWARLESAGVVTAGTIAADIARVEAGRPLWGTDVDENTLGPEANLDALGGVSYTKGCYTGQETIARIHFRGHVNRALRGLRSAAPIPRGTHVVGADGLPCGDVRSSVVSPILGPIAIAMLRREVATGSDVTARWDGGDAVARVSDLPFA
ncbi:MAG: YgfZ/GcvT domain-containing protein, partial [Gemmatimonadales bacterium]